jgi:hypothetical protein
VQGVGSREKKGWLSRFSSSLCFLNRRAITVKSFTRGLSVALFSLTLLGLAGCGPDNETEAEKLAKTAGDPGKPDPKGIPTTKLPPAPSYDDFGKRAQESQKDMMKSGGYPGAKKQ